MAVKVGINGFGRIGRQVFRAMVEQGALGKEIDVVAVNDPMLPADNLAYLLKYDSTQGRFKADVKADGDSIVVNGSKVKALALKAKPEELPWKEYGVEYVLESTGLWTNAADAKGHIAAGAKKVVISAPGTGDDITVVMGVWTMCGTARRRLYGRAW